MRERVQLQLPRKKSKTCVPLAVHTLSSGDCREKFQQSLSQHLLQHPHSEATLPDHNWETLQRGITEAADKSVGRGKKRQPDRFSDAINTLMPLVTANRRAYHRFLQTHATSEELRRHQRVVKKAIDEAKEAWIGRVVKEAKCVRRDGKQRWKSIRMLQMAHVCRRPARPTRLIRRDGGMTNGPGEVRATWYEHFSSVLNIPSQYRQEVLDVLPSLPQPWSWITPPHWRS